MTSLAMSLTVIVFLTQVFGDGRDLF